MAFLATILDAPRRSPLLRTRAMRRLTLANGLVGLSSAIAIPFTPLYLTTRVGASPTEIGLLLTLSGATGVLVSSLFGSLSDQLPSRRPLIVCGCIALAACDVVYALSHSYPVVLAASLTLMTGAWVAVPQMYARCRELLDAAGAPAAFSLSALRSMVSMAWIGGPPLAALLLTAGGFPLTFLVNAGILLAAAVLVLADGEAVASAGRRAGPAPDWRRRLVRAAGSLLPHPGNAGAGAVLLSTAAIVLIQTAGTISVTTMPLLVTSTMHGSPRDVGAIFGLGATLEIPIMLGLGWAAGRYGSLPVMLPSWLFAVLYFGSLGVATATWQAAAAQVLSAVYVSGLYGAGLTRFQELVDEPGAASTLYFNAVTVGSTVAGVLWGAVVAASGYRGAYAACVALAAASIVLLGAGRLVRPRVRGA